jgi:hypothetical protein
LPWRPGCARRNRRRSLVKSDKNIDFPGKTPRLIETKDPRESSLKSRYILQFPKMPFSQAPSLHPMKAVVFEGRTFTFARLLSVNARRIRLSNRNLAKIYSLPVFARLSLKQ